MSPKPDAHANRRPDVLLLSSVLLLLVMGLVMVLSASGVMAAKFHGGKYHFFVRQMLYAGIGLISMLVCLSTRQERLYKHTYLWLLISIGMLILTLFGPLSGSAKGAARWLRLGPIGIQPLEVAKLSLIVYLAYYFSAKQERIKSLFIGFIPPFVITFLLAGLLLLQPDMGGAAVLFMLFFLMSLAGGINLLILSLPMSAAPAAAWYLITHAAYRSNRLAAFMDPFSDPLGKGYQLVQSLYAFGTGGLLGVGLGESRQKLLFLPEAHNDFLMAVIGEELGFIGVSVVFILVGIVLWRGFVIAYAQEDIRSRLLAFGLTCMLGLGFLLNLAVVLGAIPPKGVPMPLLSYGGSHIIASLAAVGLLLNLSRSTPDAAA